MAEMWSGAATWPQSSGDETPVCFHCSLELSHHLWFSRGRLLQRRVLTLSTIWTREFLYWGVSYVQGFYRYQLDASSTHPPIVTIKNVS